ncbi:MAG: hypothetical protein L0287_03345 [Anaerolineae bacterium]|nr:hypothetical protein [Anaerolineae bacterium]MCI0609983.1 hypothetical protein [Anaerolineae bacterium]
MDWGRDGAKPIAQFEQNCELPADGNSSRLAGYVDPSLVDESASASLEVLQKILEHVLSGWLEVEAYIILDGVMIFGDR